jgi:para-nitrobenzyl esterase
MMVVETRWGRVEGVERAGVLQFLGVPYAAAPVGVRRWAAPEPPDPWTGVRPATAFGPVAPQAPSPVSSLFGIAELGMPGGPEISEDCLHLNVYTPSADGGRRPVMVWIHGGAFTGGSNRSAWYAGSSFARQGVVVVVINYRVGALGFLRLGDREPVSANRGLLDQVAALEWVRDNIDAFGGDPARVTVFGESAGAMSIGTLLGVPAAAGLFQGAILQSGAAATFGSLERASEVTDRLAAMLGGVDALRAADRERLVTAQGELVLELGREGKGLPFMPVVDGTVLPEPPALAVAAGGARVRLMAGTNRDEMTLFLALATGGGQLSEEGAVRRLDQTTSGAGRALYDAYRTLLGGDVRPAQVWVAAETDRTFRAPAIQLATEQARHTPQVWMYLFTWLSPALGGSLGACHALEIPFAWNSLIPESAGFTGAGPEAEALAREMHAAWVAFATSGDPGWEPYEEGRRATRVFGPGGGTVDDPMQARREVWRTAPPAGLPEPALVRS